ncbi:hypothetical protein [Mariniblastus fucicola]|nr:hypothetical protein [Mariniblastus fucicola]
MAGQNPYKAPVVANAAQAIPAEIDMQPKDRKKADAIIKDASQFWLAIFLCILCSALGALIIPIWYFVRLLQWNSLAKKYPDLVPDSPIPGSLSADFKSAQWKLIVGLAVGSSIFVIVVLMILATAFVPMG